MVKKPYKDLTALSADFLMSDFNKEWIYEFTFVKQIAKKDFHYFDSPLTPYVSGKDLYLKQCKEVIDNIKTGKFNKVVFSRITKKDLKVEPYDMYEQLCVAYQKAFVYLVSIENVGTWLGASPELFLDIEDGQVSTTALAATKTDANAPWGAKEVEEQAMVSRFIVSKLEKVGINDLNSKGPYTFDTGAILHIKTDLVGTLPAHKTIELINQLHPTPATCGLPQHSSLAYIRETEKHDRSFYCGFIGPTSPTNSQLFVNLRCMQIIDNDAYLYIGGGITAESVPELEWAETENKAKTLTKFLV